MTLKEFQRPQPTGEKPVDVGGVMPPVEQQPPGSELKTLPVEQIKRITDRYNKMVRAFGRRFNGEELVEGSPEMGLHRQFNVAHMIATLSWTSGIITLNDWIDLCIENAGGMKPEKKNEIKEVIKNSHNLGEKVPAYLTAVEGLDDFFKTLR